MNPADNWKECAREGCRRRVMPRNASGVCSSCKTKLIPGYATQRLKSALGEEAECVSCRRLMPLSAFHHYQRGRISKRCLSCRAEARA